MSQSRRGRQAQLVALLSVPRQPNLGAEPRIQIGEIGGPLLEETGWPSLAPGHGNDRGIDLAVRDCGRSIGEGRLQFAADGDKLCGEISQPIYAVNSEARALIWRGVALCARSMRLRSLTLPHAAPGLGEITRREIGVFGREAARLEEERLGTGHLAAGVDPLLRSEDVVPTGVRLEPPTPLGRTRRLLDIAVSSAGLVAFAPFAAVLAVLIRRSSEGPVLFRQMRIGGGGRPFPILKFRSMDNSAGADVHRAAVIDSLTNGATDTKPVSDTRITDIGAFMRKWSIDEVPQLLNVLRAEMTLVGPRPSLLWETSLFASTSRRRLQLTPGIAGLWQASGRGDLSMDEMLELDLEYADTASLLTDVKIIAQTAAAVFKKTGAR